MKRKWKYMLLIFVLLVVSVGGYGLYILKFKEYDVADPEIDTIIEDSYVLKLPDGKEVVVDKNGQILEEKTISTTDKSTANADPITTDGEQQDIVSDVPAVSENNSDVSKDGTVQVNRPTVASIKEKYIPTLKDLEDQANNNISALIGRAVNEYTTKKANGESISIGYFYTKYMSAAEGLEANTDAVFNSLIVIIEHDLEANGFDKAHAQSLRDEYEAAKEARRNSLLSKAKEFL